MHADIIQFNPYQLLHWRKKTFELYILDLFALWKYRSWAGIKGCTLVSSYICQMFTSIVFIFYVKVFFYPKKSAMFLFVVIYAWFLENLSSSSFILSKLFQILAS